ncbi:MAG: hypothetical protein NT086_11150 [Proteobacteria bacterium]|nr:hypothetical protein [Pseudomonadota bacterium]
MDYELLAVNYRPQVLAVQSLASHFGIRRASETFDRSLSMMHNAANPNLPRYQFTALQLFHMLAETKTPQLLQSLADLTGHVVVPAQQLVQGFVPGTPEQMARQVLRRYMGVSAATSGVLADAYEDLQINSVEADAIERCIDDEIAALNTIRAAVRAAVVK